MIDSLPELIKAIEGWIGVWPARILLGVSAFAVLVFGFWAIIHYATDISRIVRSWFKKDTRLRLAETSDEANVDMQDMKSNIKPIMKAEDNYADIRIKPQIDKNLAVLEVINNGADADFTTEARVIEGVPPKTRYIMCWDSPPHLAHPEVRRGRNEIYFPAGDFS